MLPQLTKIKRTALDLLFPQKCVGCGKSGSFICNSCCARLAPVAPPLCPLCGLPRLSGSLCPSCVNWQAEIDGIRSPFRFEGTMRQAVHDLKYRNIRALAEPLAQLLFNYLQHYPAPVEVLIPVPLHPKRLRERGYNQAGLLAKELGQLTGLPVADGALIRRVHTPPQAKTTSVEERRKNIEGAFTCVDDSLRGKDALLIDDVSTSGATLNACAAALKEGGATGVWGLTIAREV